MSMITDLSRTPRLPDLGGLFETLRRAWARLAERWHRHRVYRTTYEELSRLDDRTLQDLGLHRSDIPSIAWRAACGDRD